MFMFPIISGSIYIFYQSDNSPNYVSFIRYDPNTAEVTDPSALLGMELVSGDPNDGVPYQANPKACFYNNQIYVFGRTSGNRIGCMQFNGTALQGPTFVGNGNALTCASATPCVLNNQLYIIYSNSSAPYSAVVNQLDASLNPTVWSVSTTVLGYEDISPLPQSNGDQIYACGTINEAPFPCIYSATKKSITPAPSGGSSAIVDYAYDPCLIPDAPDVYTLFSKKNAGFGVVAMSIGNEFDIGLETITAVSSPSIVSLGDGENYLVFYASQGPLDEDVRTLKVASLYIDFANSAGSVNTITNFQIPLAPANCSPCAVLIP